MLNKEVPNFVNLGTKFGTFQRNMNLCGIRKMLLSFDNLLFIYMKFVLFTYFNLIFLSARAA